MLKSAMKFGGLLIILLAALLVAQPASAELQPVRIGVIIDGPWERNDEIRGMFEEEITALLQGEYDVSFPTAKRIECDWSPANIAAAIDRLLADPDVDIVLGMGVITSHLLCQHTDLTKPVIAPFVIDHELQGIPFKDGASGVHNLCYIAWPFGLQRDLDVFHEIVSYKHLTLLFNKPTMEAIPNLKEACTRRAILQGVEFSLIAVDQQAEDALAAIPANTDAVYVGALLRLAPGEFDKLVAGLIARHLPSFSLFGRSEVERGILAGLLQDDNFRRLARRAALNIQRILFGEEAGALPVPVSRDERLTINMRTARAIGVYPNWGVLTEADVIGTERTEVRRQLTITSAVSEAIDANLEYAASAHSVAAGAQDVNDARSNLLPQLDVSALGTVIDEDRAAVSNGAQPERRLTGSLTVEQLIFSEPAWANLSIQKRLQLSREQEREQLRLDIAHDAAQAYLQVLRAKTLERIQQDNLKLTRSNLELAQLRKTVGISGPAEVYRWESQIATSRKNVIAANAQRNLAEMALNRLLHRPLEENFLTDETGLDDPALITSDRRFVAYFANPWTFKIFRTFMEEDGLAHSPELQQFDGLIAAQDRLLRSSKWKFFAPTIAAQGQVTNTFSRAGAGADFPASLGSATPDDVDWNVGLRISLPLFEGGSRFAVRTQAREELSQLEIERNAAAERIALRIRAALHLAGASHAGIRLSQDAAEASRNNLNLVTDAYSSGTVSIIDLLDAQNAALVADQSAANAVYDFLLDLMEVERAIGQFDFFASADERANWFQRAGQYIELHNTSEDQ